MAAMTPISRKSGDQYLHRKTVVHRENQPLARRWLEVRHYQ
jgi:hypothetical protein